MNRESTHERRRGHARGLEVLVDQTVRLGERAGASRRGRKVLSLVFAMWVCADCIDDCDILRAGNTAAVLGQWPMAPSTLGTFLGSFTFGHVRQLDRVLAVALRRAWGLGAGPGSERLVIDVDSFVGEVHGHAKRGAGYGYTYKLGYHPILATRADTSECCGEAVRVYGVARCRLSSSATHRRARTGRFSGAPSRVDLERVFFLDDADRALVDRRRGVHNRLGFALQITTVRSVRTDGGLRIYLDRLCYSSGTGEPLGVSLARDAGAWAPDREEWKPFITQWGQDPIWESVPLPDFPALGHFPDAVATERGLPLDAHLARTHGSAPAKKVALFARSPAGGHR